MINRAILYNKFVRYDVLKQMLNSNPSTKDMIGHGLDIFIDIQSIYKDVLSSEIIGSDTKTIAVNVLNMAAHYRHFFRNLLKTQVRVFLVNSKVNLIGNICEIHNLETNEEMFRILEVLCKYLPDIYYIYRKNVNPICIIQSFLLSKITDNAPSRLVISNDVYAYQLAALFTRCYMLRLGIKHKYIVTSNNSIDLMFGNTTPSSDLHPGLIPVIMAFNKCKELGLPLVYPYKKALNTVRELISKGYLYQGYNAPYTKFDEITGLMGIEARWVMCDLNTQALSYAESPEILDDTWAIKKYCDLTELASLLDNKFNNDPDNILNYIYLLE